MAGARFCGQCGTSLVDMGATIRSDSSRQLAERRQLTVLFCDIVDSTVLATQLDPEDFRDLIATYQDRVASAIGGLQGYVARFVGDGVLAYFGWPNVDEAHAESAVRAGLDIIDALRPLRFAVRIGIATGLVVVGDLISVTAIEKLAATGETLHLAARLQSIAEPGTILVSKGTCAQLGRLFNLKALGPIEMKGFKDPQWVWQVLGDTTLSSRSEAIYGGALAPLIGRGEELDALLRRWRQLKSGEGHVVLISGEPGIGKSRLIAELEERLAGQQHASLRYFCSPHHQEDALYPIIYRLQQEAGFGRGDSPEDRLEKLEAVLAPAATPAEDVVLFADLLSVPVGDTYPRLDLSPQLKKRKTLEALIRRLTGLVRGQPALVLLEDAHWADPSSLELVDELLDRLTELEVLLVISFRPEFAAPWVGRAGVSLIALSRLGRRQSAALAAQVALAQVLPLTLLERIVVQADGVPLFIEELTRTVLESAGQNDHALLSVPDTLQASLMARLDRLPAAKQVAQVGSVIGREFSHALVAQIAQLPEAQLTQGLDELVQAGLAFRRGVPPEAVYSFKHMLVQEAVYDSLLRGRRTALHGAVVATVEAESSVATIEPGLLGHHCAQAGLLAKAAFYYRIAGERSAERSAAVETRAQLERGLHFAGSLPDGPDRHRLESELLLALGRILMNTKGPANAEASAALARAAAISRQLDEPEALARALFALGNITMNRGDSRTAQSLGEDLLALGEACGDSRLTAAARARLGALAYFQGRFEAARDHLSEALALCAQGEPAPLGVAISSAPNVTAAAYLASALACLGYPESATDQARLAVESARQLGSSSLSFALAVTARALLTIRDDALCRKNTEEQVAISEKQGFQFFLTTGQCYLGWITAKQGPGSDGLRMLTEGLASLDALEIEVHGTWTRGLLADALSWAGRRSEALSILDDALALSARTGVAWFDAELHRRKGELLLAQPHADPPAAEMELRHAIEVARDQSARMFELRAAVSLSRLWLAQERRVEARELLAPLFLWFTEGFDRPDLQEAKALLDELEMARSGVRDSLFCAPPPANPARDISGR
jgi:class 3 adenylate cyclase/tetratricopeptide (TPR) repeat protein